MKKNFAISQILFIFAIVKLKQTTLTIKIKTSWKNQSSTTD